MEKINEEFNIPYYIFKEILEYIEQTTRGRCMKWENIKLLLNCAKVNNRFTQEQVDFIVEKYCRE